MSRMRKSSEEMDRIISKHSLDDIEDRIIYIANKIQKYGTTDYPYNTLLILDDAADSDLLKKNSPLIKIMTKTRHYNLTLLAQTPNDLDKKSITQQYLQLKDPHSKFIMNITAGKYTFE